MRALTWFVAVVLVGGLGSFALGDEPKAGDVKVFGFNLHYVEAGSGSPVVLLHGLWGGRNEWAKNIEPLAADFRVIVPDQIGFGESGKPGANYHMGLMAQFLVGFLDALEIPKATLIGHAMGATVATYAAVHYPDRIDRIVLVDGIGYRRDRPVQLPTAGQLRFRRIATGSSVEATRGLLKRRVHNDSLITDAWAKTAFEFWLQSSHAIGTLIQSGGDVTTEEMRSIKAPTLLVWGKEDEIGGPEATEEALGDIPGSQAAIIDNAGHLPQVEQPEEFNRVVRDFVKKQ
jgi:pimeloyl-ACP methyl ester carboxylesterase